MGVDMTLIKEYGEIEIIQYHDKQTHYKIKQQHSDACEQNGVLKTGETHFNVDTLISDNENKLYAEFLTENLKKYDIRVTYKIFDECDIFHKKYKNEKSQIFDNPKDYLIHSKHKNNVIFKPDWLEKPNIREDELLQKIENSNLCDGGFVVIQKGARETENDFMSKQFAFCLQRNNVSVNDIGEGNYRLIYDLFKSTTLRGKEEKKQDYLDRIKMYTENHLKNRLKNEFTYTRRHFQQDQCLPVVYFKFLRKYRKLDDVIIIHYIHYESRDYSYEFILHSLQARHDIKRFMEIIENPLEEITLKTLANSIYGQFLMEIIKYFKYTYVTDESLYKNKMKNNIDINLVTVVPTKKKKK